MPKQITARDTTTGKTVTFNWNGEGNPTDADMEEVFAAATAAAPAKQAMTPVSPDEPGTYWGGFGKSMLDTATRTGGGIVRGMLQTINPMTYINQMQDKQATEERWKDAVTPEGTFAPAPATGDYGVGNLKALGQRLSTPEGGGEAIGGLLSAAAQPAVSRGVGNTMRRGALRLTQSALKPTATLVKERAGAGFPSKESVAQAVLDEGRIVSPGNLVKAQEALDVTDAAAHAALQEGAGAGVKVSPRPVARAITEQASDAGPFGKQINAAPDVADIKKVERSFLNNPNIPRVEIRRPTTTTTNINTGLLDEYGQPITRQQSQTVMKKVGSVPQPIDAVTAHEFAMNTGRNLKGKFGRLGPATVEAEKAGRAAITGELRAKIPELEPLWQQEARQITVRDALKDAQARVANRDIFGLSGVAGAIRSPGLAAMALADRSAFVKSLLGKYVNKAGLSNVPGAALRAAILTRLQGETGKREE